MPWLKGYAHWLLFLTRCFVLLKPGGWVVITEGEGISTNLPALERLHEILCAAFFKMGYSLSDSPRSFGIVAQLGHLLNAGSVTGRVELEYSSVCQTNWDQIYSGNGAEYLAGCVVRKAGPDGPFDSDCYHSTVSTWINTNMLWSPHNLDEATGCFQGPCIGDSSGLHAGFYVETGYY